MDPEKKLNNCLQCHVCFEEYKINQKIWQCRSGHSVCHSCRSQLEECPFCKAPYEGTRNYAVEDIISELHSENIGHKLDGASIPTNQTLVSPSDASCWAIDLDEVNDMVVVELPQRVVQDYHFDDPWIRCTSESIPFNAIIGGRDHGNEPLLIGRAHHGRALLPGKVNRNYKKCFVAWENDELEKSNFEVLCNIAGTWLPNSGGIIPAGAFAAGYTESMEPLYIGRARIKGTLTIGRVQPSHRCCYLSYGGIEYAKTNYEIYVLDPSS